MPIIRCARAALLAGLAVLSMALWAADASAQSPLITLATAGKQGIYYPAGGAICRLVNAGRFEHGIRCLTEATQGSVANLRGIRSGLYDLGLAQSDWHFHAFHGTDAFAADGSYRELRSVFSLHSEAFTVVARRDAEIRSFTDLKGKRVNVGPPGSGNRATIGVVMDAFGMSEGDLTLAAELPSEDQAGALCDGSLDAVIFLAGHPNRSVEDMTKACEAVLVPVVGEPVDELVATHPYYRSTTIPADTYPGHPEPVPTFGLGATVVTSVRTEARIVYEVVKAVFDNFEAFKAMHPALAGLDRERMVRDLLTAPLHVGALRYVRRHTSISVAPTAR